MSIWTAFSLSLKSNEKIKTKGLKMFKSINILLKTKNTPSQGKSVLVLSLVFRWLHNFYQPIEYPCLAKGNQHARGDDSVFLGQG